MGGRRGGRLHAQPWAGGGRSAPGLSRDRTAGIPEAEDGQCSAWGAARPRPPGRGRGVGRASSRVLNSHRARLLPGEHTFRSQKESLHTLSEEMPEDGLQAEGTEAQMPPRGTMRVPTRRRAVPRGGRDTGEPAPAPRAGNSSLSARSLVDQTPTRQRRAMSCSDNFASGQILISCDFHSHELASGFLCQLLVRLKPTLEGIPGWLRD